MGPPLKRIPVYDDYRASQLHYLGRSLRGRFIQLDELSDLEHAVMMSRLAVELTPPKHPKESARLHDLGATLEVRFLRLGVLDDIELALVTLQHALRLTPKGQQENPAILADVGISLFARFQYLGELDDIEHSITVHRRAVELTPDGHPEKVARLDNLGVSLLDRFRHLGELDDLVDSITVRQIALELTPVGHPERAAQLESLGVSLGDRFQRLGRLDDLERSVVVHQEAVDITPEGHPYEAVRLDNLGASLLERFQRLGELGDLEHSIAVKHRAINLTPEEHPEKAERFSSLGISLFARFQQLKEPHDLEHAIAVYQSAVELTPEEHPEKAAMLQSLGAALRDRFRHFGELDDLERAITCDQSAVELTPDEHPEKATRLENLGVSLNDRFRHLGELDDLGRAIAAKQRALELTPEGHPHGAERVENLGVSLLDRFERLGDYDDLEHAIAYFQDAVERTPEGHPDKGGRLLSLGLSLELKFNEKPNEGNFDAAVDCLLKATVQSSGQPSVRWDSARSCVRLVLVHYPEFGSEELLLLALARAIEVLPEIVWLGHGVSRRYEECAKHNGTVSAAICTAINCRAFSQAIEWLEAGRSFVWSQLLALSTPFEDLRERRPDLAEDLEKVSQSLRREGHSSPHSSGAHAPSIASMGGSGDRHRQLAIDYDQVVKKIRSCTGFEDFLCPPKISSLLAALKHTDGPVVFINVHRVSCDALVPCSDGSIQHIKLHQLTADRANKLRSLWIQALESNDTRVRRAMAPESFTIRSGRSMYSRILGRLWAWIVEPILQHLNLMDPDTLAHITWCPTGPLTQLPLHAAGVYDMSQDYRPHVFDFIVSSYTPSLSALLQRKPQVASEPVSPPSLLMIAQPETPGLSALPGTREECTRIRAALPQIACTSLEHEGAIVSDTLAVMDQHPWVHLACHGKQDATDPTQSAFALYDGPLTLSALMSTVSDNAELAFLSACQTAVGDEKIPEESAHLAAGMMVVGFKGVVATVWSIGDEDAPIVAEAYYKKLVELRSSGAFGKGGATGAAYALHEAVRVLREKVGEESIVKWAPFVHFGV